jgi:hypothetical protein
MARQLQQAASPQPLPGAASLQHNPYRWERGLMEPRERYKLLYCQVFGLTEHELFGTGPPPTALSPAVPEGCQRLTIEFTTHPSGPAAAHAGHPAPSPAPEPVIIRRYYRA